MSIEKINVNISGIHILKEIDISLNVGELVVVVGSNGSGKSTLMRTIAGLEHPYSGKINFEGEDIQNEKPFDISAKGVSLVPEGRSLFGDMTVLENLLMGAFLYKKERERISKNLKWVYSLFPQLERFRNRVSSSLSGGEQQMLTIGRGLMTEPRLLMLDELSLGLAPIIIEMLLKIIKKLNEEGMTILLVEQNVRQALKIVDRGYVLDNGKIVLEGTGEEMLNDNYVKSSYMGI